MNALVRNLLFALLAVGAIAAAGDQAPASEQGSAAAQAQGGAPEPAAESTQTPKANPTPTPTADPDEQLEEFVPSEEVPADRAVAFPVDI